MIEGATVFSPVELTPLYDDYLTREVGTAELVAIAAAITDKYRAHGYFLSQAVVPPQAPSSGVGRIVVYEGYVADLDITGSGAAVIGPYLRDIEGKRPLRLADLDQALSLAGDAPGVTLRPQLQPVIDNPADHRLVVDSALDRQFLSIYVDNRGPRTAGPWQAFLNGGLNSALVPGDRLGVTVLTALEHPRDFTYVETNYSAPMGPGRLRGYIGLSRANDGADQLSRAIGGESWSVGAVYQHPLKRTRTANVSAAFTANVRHTEQDWNDVGGYADDIHVARTAINANLGLPSRSTNLFGQLSMGARDEVETGGRGLSRTNAARSFWKFNAHVSHYRDLGAHFGLYLAADAQWSPDALLSSEELAIGGAPYGRGYSYAEISGDRGVAGTAELRAGWDPNWKSVSFLQGYGFLDAGKVWNVGAGARGASLASGGFGVRIRLGDRATIGLEAARPLTRTPYEPGDKDWRTFATLSARL